MMEVKNPGKAVLIKKGQAIPENAEPMSDTDVIEIQEGRIERFKPQDEMSAFTWKGQTLVGLSAASSSFILNSLFRANFKLGGLARMATYMPVVLVPTFCSVMLHDFAIKRRVLLGKEDCSICLSLRSGAYQTAVGVAYPYIISLLACTVVAREHYTLPMPIQNSGAGVVGYLRVLRRVSPSASTLLLLGVYQMLIGMKMGDVKWKVFHKHLSKPPTEADLPLKMRYGK